MSKTRTVERLVWLDMVSRDPTISASAFRMAYVISGYINEVSGVAWPALALVAKECHLHQDGRGARTLIGALKKRGFLDVKQPGRGGSNRYVLTFPGNIRSRSDLSDKTACPDRHKTAGLDRLKTAGLDRLKTAPQTGSKQPPISSNEIFDSSPSRFRTEPGGDRDLDEGRKRLSEKEATSTPVSASRSDGALTIEEGKRAFAELKAELKAELAGGLRARRPQPTSAFEIARKLIAEENAKNSSADRGRTAVAAEGQILDLSRNRDGGFGQDVAQTPALAMALPDHPEGTTK